MLSGSNASLQGRRKNLNYKVSSVSLSEPNVRNVGKEKMAVVPIDCKDEADAKVVGSDASLKSATYPRPSDSVRIVDEISKVIAK